MKTQIKVNRQCQLISVTFVLFKTLDTTAVHQDLVPPVAMKARTVEIVRNILKMCAIKQVPLPSFK